MLAKELDPRRHAAFFHERQPRTPCLVIDLEMVEARYRELRAAMPAAGIHYAVKACPEPEVIDTLAALGSSFDVASVPELDLCLARGVTPERISYGNTAKKEEDIALAYQRGVRLFALDSLCELHKLSRAAPGAAVFCRILVSNEGAQWPMSRKHGCSPDMAADLLTEARALGLQPCGVSFHPGSQQLDPTAWQAGCDRAASIFSRLRSRGIRLSLLNLGGGFPARYDPAVPGIDEYAKAIDAAAREAFGPQAMDFMVEPGRGIAGDAGVMWSQVILKDRKDHDDLLRWVFVDTGRFGGLAETEGGAIRYPIIAAPERGGPTSPVILAGPTCDGVDIIYDDPPVCLPSSLQVGDYLGFLSAGAYTAPYAAHCFNGFPPPQTYCFGS